MGSINEIVSNLESFELSHCPEDTLSTYTSCFPGYVVDYLELKEEKRSLQ